MHVAGGIAAAHRPPHRRGRGTRDICRRRRNGTLAGCTLEPGAEFARQFLESAALAGTERRRLFGRKRLHVFRPRFPFGFGRRRRCLRPALFERGQAIDVAANPEAAITGKLAVAAENRQARHLDRQRLILTLDRPGHDDAAPGAARGQRVRYGALRIELELGGDVRPRAAKHGHGLRTEHLGEIFRSQGETVRRVDLPDEAQRKAVRRQFPRSLTGIGRRRLRNGKTYIGVRRLFGRDERGEQRHR